jgi:hypothetical protein
MEDRSGIANSATDDLLRRPDVGWSLLWRRLLAFGRRQGAA